MTEHTPGPWEWGLHPPENLARLLISQADTATPVAEVRRASDARLIAAAPDLLAACEAMRGVLSYDITGCAPCLSCDAVRQACTAIARARGEQP